MKLNVVSHATLLSPKTNNQRNEDRLYASVESNLVLPQLKIVPEMLTADVGATAHFKCQGSALNEISGHEITEDGKIKWHVKFILQKIVILKKYNFIYETITNLKIFDQLFRFFKTIRR